MITDTKDIYKRVKIEDKQIKTQQKKIKIMKKNLDKITNRRSQQHYTEKTSLFFRLNFIKLCTTLQKCMAKACLCGLLFSF